MSAIAEINTNSAQITIKALLVLYGKYASNELGDKIVAEINQMWNEPNANLELEGKPYNIRFEITYSCVSNEEIIKLALQNTNYAVNFIRIEDKNLSERSMMGFGLGENSGHWLITDQLGESTTAAHEFGHALGLPHPEQLDFRFTGMPPIMAPRGTIVDAEFQWNPLAEPGMPGGTMRPIFRRVRATEVLEILGGFDLGILENINIGGITNHLFDEIGQPVALQQDLTFK